MRRLLLGFIWLVFLSSIAHLAWVLFNSGPRGRVWSLPQSQELRVVQGHAVRVVEGVSHSGTRRRAGYTTPARHEFAASDGSAQTFYCSPETPSGRCFDPIAAELGGQPLVITYFKVGNVGDQMEERDILLDATSADGVLVPRQDRLEDLAWEARQSDRSHQLGTWLTIAMVVIFGPIFVAIFKYEQWQKKNG